jgi:hypothetical protein
MSLFPFDPTGRLNANRIQNEAHTVTAINGVDHNYLIPVNAPFFNESMTVINLATGEALTENEDFYFGYSFAQATEQTGKAISGAIVFIDPDLTGQFYLNYQTLGGEYVDEETRAIEDGLDALDRLLNPDWSDLVNVPAVFPPTPHMLRLDEVVGVAEIIARLDEIEIALRDDPRRITMGDIVDLEESYTGPLLNSLGEIAQAIEQITQASAIHYVEDNTVTRNSDIIDPLPDTWYPTGATVTIAKSGTYHLTVSGNPRVLGSVIPIEAVLRFTVDGVPVSQSILSTTVIGLTAGQQVAVDVIALGAGGTRIATSGPTYGCGLTLLRVSD